MRGPQQARRREGAGGTMGALLAAVAVFRGGNLNFRESAGLLGYGEGAVYLVGAGIGPFSLIGIDYLLEIDTNLDPASQCWRAVFSVGEGLAISAFIQNFQYV